MKRFILFVLLTARLFAEDAINIATEDYGALTLKTKNIVEVNLPTKTNVDEIKLAFKPNKGKLVVLAKEDKNEKEIAAIHLDGTEEDISFKLQKTFLKDVKVIFIPEDPDRPLTLYTYAFNVVDVKTIQFYNSLQKAIVASGGPTDSAVAGSSTTTAAVSTTTTTVPSTLPTEFTISRSSL